MMLCCRKKQRNLNEILASSYDTSNLPHLLIIINPIGGKRNAWQIFDQVVAPRLKKANIEYVIKVTEYSGHCSKIIKNADFSMVTGIIGIGGDGHLNQIVNGIVARTDHSSIFKNVPIGVIAAGTGNGVAKSLGILDPIEAINAIILNQTKQINMIVMEKMIPDYIQEECWFGILSLTCGFIATFDKLMEQKFRYMRLPWTKYSFPVPGWFRWLLNNILIPIYLISKNPRYKININILPADTVIDNSFWKPHPDNEKAQKGWVNFQGYVQTFALCNLPYIASDICIAPKALEHIEAGTLDLLLVKPISRLELLNFFLKAEKGNHVNSPNVQYLSIKEFELVNNTDNENVIMFDGEEVHTVGRTLKSNPSFPHRLKIFSPLK